MSTDIHDILDKYRLLGIIKAGEILLKPVEALSLLEELETKHVRVYGVDFWYYQNTKIVEDFNSLDLSNTKDPEESVQIAKTFLMQFLPKEITLVSLVLDD